MKSLLNALNAKKSARVEFQLFDSRLIATWKHLYFAALNALVSFRSKRNISKDVAIETLLYASAQGQIQKATRLLGVKPDSLDIAVVIVGEQSEPIRSLLSAISENAGGRRDDRVLEVSEGKFESIQKSFGISENQLRTAKRGRNLVRALVDLVIERVALAAVQN